MRWAESAGKRLFCEQCMAVVAALIAACGYPRGRYAAAQPPFDYRKIGDTFRNRKLRLANFGYLDTCGAVRDVGLDRRDIHRPAIPALERCGESTSFLVPAGGYAFRAHV